MSAYIFTETLLSVLLIGAFFFFLGVHCRPSYITPEMLNDIIKHLREVQNQLQDFVEVRTVLYHTSTGTKLHMSSDCNQCRGDDTTIYVNTATFAFLTRAGHMCCKCSF